MFKGYLTIFLLILYILTFSQSFDAKVLYLKDGDSFVIETMGEKKKELEVRLANIDCPEHSQEFGSEAKMITALLVGQKIISVEIITIDKYGRSIVEVTLPDGQSLNKLLIINGCAWHFNRFSKSKELADLEKKARASKVGLWKNKNAIAPWDFREMKK